MNNLHSPPYLNVKKIKGKGRGVVTSISISKGSIICKCPIIPLNFNDTFLVSTTSLHYYLFDYIDSCRAIVLGLGSLINHSDKPNARWTIRKRSQEIVFWAKRDIKRDEEITHNYNWDSKMWRNRCLKS